VQRLARTCERADHGVAAMDGAECAEADQQRSLGEDERPVAAREQRRPRPEPDCGIEDPGRGDDCDAPGGHGGEGRIRLVGLVENCPANVQPVIGPTVAQMSMTNGTLKLEGTARAGDSLLIYAETQGSWNYLEPLRTMVTEHGDWRVLCPQSMATCSHISVLEQIHTADAAPFVQSPLWVFSTQTVTPPEATSDVTVQEVSHALSIGVVRFDANWLHASITGSSMELIDYRLVDILGRELTRGSLQLDGAGNYQLDLNSSMLKNGNYILAVRTGVKVVSKNISIAR